MMNPKQIINLDSSNPKQTDDNNPEQTINLGDNEPASHQYPGPELTLNYMPRTERSMDTGLPEVCSDGFFDNSQSTIEMVTYNDWVTATSTIGYTVGRMVTLWLTRCWFSCKFCFLLAS